MLFVLSVTSCKLDNSCSKSTTIVFSNKGTSAGQLIVSNGLDSVLIDLNSNDVASKELCFSDSLKSDGHYTLRFSNNKRDTTFNFGYYTNGAPLEKEFKITWANDSLKVKSIPPSY